MILETGKSFKDITSIKTGGEIKRIFYPKSIKELLNFIKTEKKYLIVGNGTNILASDDYFDATVIKLNKLNKIKKLYNNKIIVSSNVTGSMFSRFVLNNGYKGADYIYTIPGTIGGMVYMNAGCYGNSISDNLLYIIGIKNNKIKKIYKNELKFGYRTSLLQNDEIICLFAVFKFSKNSTNEISKIKQYLKQRRENQPINTFNLGSVFKNGDNYSSWKLIKELGLSGYQINDAKISEKHSNFIINVCNAKSIDILNLMNYIKEKVRLNMNINLVCEWKLINWN